MGFFRTIVNALGGKSANQQPSGGKNVFPQRVDTPLSVIEKERYHDFSIITNLTGFVYNDPTTGMPVNFYVNVSIMFSYDYSRYGDIHQGDATCKSMEATAIEVMNTFITKYRTESGGNFEGLREYLKSYVVTYEVARMMSNQKRNDGFSGVCINVRDAFLTNGGQI